MDPTVHQLRCFLAVADELHFAHAAARLGLRPSSLSEQISTLEHRLSRVLFHRSPRGVGLTPDGRELVPLAQRAVAGLDAVVSWAAPCEVPASVRVGLMVSQPGVRRILAAAATQLPEVSWHLRQLDFSESYDALDRGDVDCVFVTEVGDPPRPDVEALALWEEGCVVILAEGHRLAGRTSVVLADLGDEIFVSSEGRAEAARWVTTASVPDGPAPRTVFAARGIEEVLELVGAGVGVNIAGASAPGTYSRPGLCFVPILDAPTITTYLCLRGGPQPPAVEQFVRLAIATTHMAA